MTYTPFNVDQSTTRLVIPNSVPEHIRQNVEVIFIFVSGGFTSWEGMGGWLNPANDRMERELVRIYEISDLSPEDLKAVAHFILENSQEQSVYSSVDGHGGLWERDPPASHKPAGGQQ